MFATESRAVAWFEKYRWGNKAICSRCDKTERVHGTSPVNTTIALVAVAKSFQSRWGGTVMEGSNLELRKWLFAMYLVVTSCKGISSLQLSKELGITQKSAWFMLHRIREMCDNDIPELAGIIEVDETYIGEKEANLHSNKKLRAGRGLAGKQPVFGMRERGGRVKAKPISETTQETMRGEIATSVKPGGTVYTDEHRGYVGLDKCSYKHKSVKHSGREFVNGMAHTNGIESVWAVLKRGYNWVYYNWSKKHYGRYINEFAFRLNEDNCWTDTIDRLKVQLRLSIGKRLKYGELVQ